MRLSSRSLVNLWCYWPAILSVWASVCLKYYFSFSFIIIKANIYWALTLYSSLFQALYISYDLHSNPEISYYYYSHSLIRKVRHREIGYFVRSHTASNLVEPGLKHRQSDSRAFNLEIPYFFLNQGFLLCFSESRFLSLGFYIFTWPTFSYYVKFLHSSKLSKYQLM